jgi:hypothetical protein
MTKKTVGRPFIYRRDEAIERLARRVALAADQERLESSSSASAERPSKSSRQRQPFPRPAWNKPADRFERNNRLGG